MKKPARVFRALPAASIHHGEVVHWNDEKGYGFIRTSAEQPNIFFHISAFAYQKRRPQKGDQVCFLTRSDKNKISARRVLLMGHENGLFDTLPYDSHTSRSYFTEAAIYALLDMLFYAVLATISTPIAIASGIISVLTVSLYSLDKHASLHNHQRIPEASLHLAALLGGWPGALIARPLLRHKTRKNRFILFFWLSIVVNFFCLYIITWYFAPLH